MSKKQRFVLPPMDSFGLRVRDVESTVEFYSEVFGIGPFETVLFEPEKHWVGGEPFPIRMKIASVQMGSVRMDLLEPLGAQPHQWRLDSKGEGIDYLAFRVNDYEGWIDYLTGQGMEVIQNAEFHLPKKGYVKAAYMGSDRTGGVMIEIATSVQDKPGETSANDSKLEAPAESDSQRFALPPLRSFGLRVRDVGRTIEFYSEVLGIGPFESVLFEPEKHWVGGKPFPIQMKIAVVQMGQVKMNLLEPIGDQPHRWRLDRKGEGVDYLAFQVDDYEGWIDYLTGQGMEVLQNAEFDLPGLGHIQAAYMVSDRTGGVIIEIGKVTPR